MNFWRVLARLFMLLGGLSASERSNAAEAALGVLTPFYRSTQLQGHLFGMGLTEIPDYLLSSDLAFPYRKKAGWAMEIPFVDTFTINRVMGGYREDWLRKFHKWDDHFGRRSLDYVVRGSGGTLQFRPELLRQRLQPYLDAGYKPSDITLALDNTPWDLATPDDGPPQEGPWGRNTPPGNMDEWSTVVRHFAADLKAFLGPAAEQIGFETGVEYDEKVSFDGSAADFFRYYETTDRALHEVLPGAHLNPGEFTGAGTCEPDNPGCVYDTRAFLDFARREHLQVSDVPRSLHALVDRADPWPSATAQRFTESYGRLPGVIEEVHQFGLLFEPFGKGAGPDPGPMQASWEFQTLARLLQNGAPRRVYHWGGVASVGRLRFLNGAGFLRLVLDHYLGRSLTMLTTHDADAQRPYRAETLAVALTGNGPPALILSSFSPRPEAGTRPVTVDLPSDWPSSLTRCRTVRSRVDGNVFNTVKQDLAADDNLKPAFADCAQCLGTPMMMAKDFVRARGMLFHKWPSYQAVMQASLRWKDNDTTVARRGSSVTADLAANDLTVIECVK